MNECLFRLVIDGLHCKIFTFLFLEMGYTRGIRFLFDCKNPSFILLDEMQSLV